MSKSFEYFHNDIINDIEIYILMKKNEEYFWEQWEEEKQKLNKKNHEKKLINH